MRIVAGAYGGRRLMQPKGRDVRPTSDKVRGAMFNILRGLGAVDGARVLDAFCGTGALGLEALSQGSAHVVFVDKVKASLDLARGNAQALGPDGACDFILKDAGSLRQSHLGSQKFDLVFLDPPYRKDYVPKLLELLALEDVMRDGCVCVLEVEKAFQNAFNEPYVILQEKVYGDTKVIFLRYSPGQ